MAKKIEFRVQFEASASGRLKLLTPIPDVVDEADDLTEEEQQWAVYYETIADRAVEDARTMIRNKLIHLRGIAGFRVFADITIRDKKGWTGDQHSSG